MRLFFSESTNPAYNLALEEYLLLHGTDDILLFYVNSPCVVLGYNQCLQNEVNVDFCKANNIEVFRRTSGGGAVYHDTGNLNFSFIGQVYSDDSVLTSDFLLPVVAWLNTLGVDVSIGKRKDLWLPNARKIGGTASKISKGRSLQHGTILFDANLEWLKNSLSSNHINPDVRATKSVRSETANILSYLYNKTNQTLNPEGLIEAMVKIAAEYYEVDIERQVVVGDSFQSVFDRLNDENYISRK